MYLQQNYNLAVKIDAIVELLGKGNDTEEARSGARKGIDELLKGSRLEEFDVTETLIPRPVHTAGKTVQGNGSGGGESSSTGSSSATPATEELPPIDYVGLGQLTGYIKDSPDVDLASALDQWNAMYN
ncbi:hypothetical protein ACNFIC_02845 [Pseudomonas sp. NY15463]|uniref:hypothetical protein n=1 Tax=Pseudomonas sp. NY15463 TaxID=3400361 RepID=UPI003A89C0A0